jgi:A/G-specific adenine glycosylase
MPVAPAPQSARPSPRSVARARRRLLEWYDAEHRDFPWRGVIDPYAVLVSEVMLQQTQASRIAERFPAWMDRFPTAASLAEASPAAVLAAWSGLGYNRRALALQRCAVAVTRDGWPRDVEGLQRLPGIGPYTARAVASLAFGQPVGVVDTNVRRWLLRRFMVPDRPRELQGLADALASGPGDPAAWTHASMEFGAAVCRARTPRCAACPIRRGCPSRRVAVRVAVPRQPAFHGSDRAYRGTLLRLLADVAPPHRLPEAELRAALAGASRRAGPPLGDADWDRLLGRLAAEGLVHRSGEEVGLGGKVAAATIGP